MVYGLWSMVYGLWFMVYGLWSMVWSMVYGLWSMAAILNSSDLPPRSSERCAFSNKDDITVHEFCSRDYFFKRSMLSMLRRSPLLMGTSTKLNFRLAGFVLLS